VSEGNGESRPVKHVVLGMPGYGNLTAGAALGFYRASNRPNYRLNLRMLSSSLLAMNFNRLWCFALNESRPGGGGCDYFAMQHSDIEPEEFWLDKLIDELEANDLDVLGVVAPIKGTAGTTSTALARTDGVTWRPLCRLTMKEVYRLPPTFTSADVGHPLMLNTGLWVCKFREEWARKCFFTINDRISLAADGSYVPENEPEDWFFSRLLHELGLKVGCTRAVSLGHRGEMVFGNTRGWGEWDHDRAFLSQTVVPGVGWFPEDADGWLTEYEGRELARLAAGKRVLEVGSYCGRSTICLAKDAASVVAVDPHDGRGTPNPRDTLAEFKANLVRHGVWDKVCPRVGPFAEVAPQLTGTFDLVFIDGAHDRESVESDIRLARERLAPGGLIAFHDYRRPIDPGVTEAVDELLAGGAELLGRFESLAVVRPPANVPSLVED
jgi:SAM-dependent methyltransferase